VTQLPLAAAPTQQRKVPLSPLAARVSAWAREHAPARFWQLCDALPGVSASDVDAAAREARVLRWVATEGVRGRFDVQSPEGERGERL
jgi:hypothetical protein